MWLELIKNYKLEIHYHMRKANVVADVLSRKGHCNCLTVAAETNTLCDEFRRLEIEMVEEGFLANLKVKSTLLDQIKEAQKNDKGVSQIHSKMGKDQAACLSMDEQGVLWFRK